MLLSSVVCIDMEKAVSLAPSERAMESCGHPIVLTIGNHVLSDVHHRVYSSGRTCDGAVSTSQQPHVVAHPAYAQVPGAGLNEDGSDQNLQSYMERWNNLNASGLIRASDMQNSQDGKIVSVNASQAHLVFLHGELIHSDDPKTMILNGVNVSPNENEDSRRFRCITGNICSWRPRCKMKESSYSRPRCKLKLVPYDEDPRDEDPLSANVACQDEEVPITYMHTLGGMDRFRMTFVRSSSAATQAMRSDLTRAYGLGKTSFMRQMSADENGSLFTGHFAAPAIGSAPELLDVTDAHVHVQLPDVRLPYVQPPRNGRASLDLANEHGLIPPQHPYETNYDPYNELCDDRNPDCRCALRLSLGTLGAVSLYDHLRAKQIYLQEVLNRNGDDELDTVVYWRVARTLDALKYHLAVLRPATEVPRAGALSSTLSSVMHDRTDRGYARMRIPWTGQCSHSSSHSSWLIRAIFRNVRCSFASDPSGPMLDLDRFVCNLSVTSESLAQEYHQQYRQLLPPSHACVTRTMSALPQGVSMVNSYTCSVRFSAQRCTVHPALAASSTNAGVSGQLRAEQGPAIPTTTSIALTYAIAELLTAARQRGECIRRVRHDVSLAVPRVSCIVQGELASSVLTLQAKHRGLSRTMPLAVHVSLGKPAALCVQSIASCEPLALKGLSPCELLRAMSFQLCTALLLKHSNESPMVVKWSNGQIRAHASLDVHAIGEVCVEHVMCVMSDAPSSVATELALMPVLVLSVCQWRLERRQCSDIHPVDENGPVCLCREMVGIDNAIQCDCLQCDAGTKPWDFVTRKCDELSDCVMLQTLNDIYTVLLECIAPVLALRDTFALRVDDHSLYAQLALFMPDLQRATWWRAPSRTEWLAAIRAEVTNLAMHAAREANYHETHTVAMQHNHMDCKLLSELGFAFERWRQRSSRQQNEVLCQQVRFFSATRWCAKARLYTAIDRWVNWSYCRYDHHKVPQSFRFEILFSWWSNWAWRNSLIDRVRAGHFSAAAVRTPHVYDASHGTDAGLACATAASTRYLPSLRGLRYSSCLVEFVALAPTVGGHGVTRTKPWDAQRATERDLFDEVILEMINPVETDDFADVIFRINEVNPGQTQWRMPTQSKWLTTVTSLHTEWHTADHNALIRLTKRGFLTDLADGFTQDNPRPTYVEPSDGFNLTELLYIAHHEHERDAFEEDSLLTDVCAGGIDYVVMRCKSVAFDLLTGYEQELLVAVPHIEDAWSALGAAAPDQCGHRRG